MLYGGEVGVGAIEDLAVDSVGAWLRDGVVKREGRERGGMRMKLEWKVFKGWCKYVYEHTGEGSPLRKFMARVFQYAIRCSSPNPDHRIDNEDRNLEGEREEGGKKREGGYSIDKLHALANDIPDLTKDLFALMRVQAFVPRKAEEVPWEEYPCEFHLHTTSTSKSICENSNESQIHVVCPMSLIPPIESWPSPVAKVQYFLQDATLKGTKAVCVRIVAEELGMGKVVVREAVERLLSAGVASWEERGVSFRLAVPRERKVEGRVRGVPAVRVWGPEELEEENLYSAED